MRKGLFTFIALLIAMPQSTLGALEISLEHPIPDAINVYVSTHGQKVLFENQMERIFWNYGLSFKSGYFKELGWSSENPVDLNNLPDQYKKYEQTLQDLKAGIHTWLNNTRFQNPKLEIKIKKVDFSLELSHLSFLPDYSLLAKTGARGGAVFVLDLVIPDIKLLIKSIRATDLNNPILHSYGFNGIRANMAPGSQPLKLKIPMFAHIDDDGKLSIQTFSTKTNVGNAIHDEDLDIKTNTSELDLALSYEKLVLSRFELHVIDDDDENPVKKEDVVKFNKSPLDKLIKDNHANLVKIAQTYIENFVQTQFAVELNDFLAKFSKIVTEVSEMDPPGVPQGSKEPKFRRSLKLDEINQTDKYLALHLSGFMEDPQKDTPATISKENHTHIEPKLAPDQYDYAFTLNKHFINRIAQLSFNRNYFSNINVKGKYIGLIAPPTLEFDDTPCTPGKIDNTFRARLSIAHDASGKLENIAFKTIRASVDFLFRLKPVPGGVAVIADSFDMNSLDLEKSETKWCPLWLLRKIISSALKDNNQAFLAKENILIETLPIPPNFTGIPAELHTICAEKSGHLIMYLNKKVGLK